MAINNDNLPEELVREILLRSPVKSLVRFRCVSKPWFSLISNPNFAKSHFELAAAPTHRLLYIDICGSETRSIDIDTSLLNDSAAPRINFPPPTSSVSAPIRGSCRGFLLLDSYPNLIIWNPSTGVHKKLSYPAIASKHVHRSSHRPLYGFGYDASTDDCLVCMTRLRRIRRGLHPFGYREMDVITFNLLSVRTNLWKEIKGIRFPYRDTWKQSGLLLNGAIHWLAFRRVESVKVIIALDLIEKNLSEVSLPDGEFVDDCLGDLWIMGGCLSLWYWRNNKTEIWAMKEYKVESSWTKYEIPWSCISPVCSAKGGEVVAYARSGRLMKFNDKGQLLEHRIYCDDPRGCKAAIYTESLLPLPSDREEAREDDQQ